MRADSFKQIPVRNYANKFIVTSDEQVMEVGAYQKYA